MEDTGQDYPADVREMYFWRLERAVWEVCEREVGDYWVYMIAHRYDRTMKAAWVIALDYWLWLSPEEREEYEMGFLEKAAEVAANGRAPTEGLDPKWAEKHPALWAHLTKGEYEDGSYRVLSTLSLFLGLEGLTVCLQDRDNKRSLFASAPSWGRAFEILEQLAQKGNKAPWRADKRDTGGSARLSKR